MTMFIKLWWKQLLVVAIAVLTIIYIYDLKTTVAEQQTTIATLKFENDVVKSNNAKLEASVAANNAAIGKLAEGADTTQKAFAALTSSVKGQLSGLDSRLKQILNDPKPLTCEDTIRYLINAAREYKQ